MPCRDNEIPESQVQAKMMQMLHTRGHYARKIQNACSAGTPDILACVHGWFLAVEVKRPSGGRITPLQELNRRNIIMNGGVALVGPSVEELDEVLCFLESAPAGNIRQALFVVPDKSQVPKVLMDCVKFVYNPNRGESKCDI